MAAGKGMQFLLLFWKNWIIQKRKWCCTILEIVMPILLSALLVLLRQAFTATPHNDITTWDEFNVYDLPFDMMHPRRDDADLNGRHVRNNTNGYGNLINNDMNRPNEIWRLAYTPSNVATLRLMTVVASRLGVNITDCGYASEEDLVAAITGDDDINWNTLAGVVFTNSFPDNNLTSKVEYKLRLPTAEPNSDWHRDWMTDQQFSQELYMGPRESWDTFGGNPGYYSHAFLTLQQAIDVAIISMQSHVNHSQIDRDVSINLQRHPFPPWYEDPFVVVVRNFLPWFIMLTFLFTAPCIVKDIVLEKERKLKETMKLMGVSNWLHWTAWFVKYFIYLSIVDIAMTILFSVHIGEGAVLHNTDPSLFFVFMLLYTSSIIMFCFAISVFFTSANIAAVASGIVFYATYYAYSQQSAAYFTMSATAKLATCLLPNAGLGFSCFLISFQEGTGVGMQWSNFYKPVNVNDNISLLHIFVMLMLDILLYGVIVWYVDAVKPGEFGVPLPWYFPFTKWYWCGTKYVEKDEECELEGLDPSQHEAQPAGQASGIKIKGLGKVFNPRSARPVVAVDDLNLNMLEGQITALLGHNGAGKTTTMWMLTGFMQPTHGTAVIGGYDIRRNLDNVRQNLGLCPQHDVLFDSLTVKEHLQFFGRLKECKDLEKEVENMISKLNLTHKTNSQAHTLSGGMKRKLSVGIALIGDPKVVILDEPSSGMDPEARRQIWDILQQARVGRTILLTTHYMDEADYLGDRIAIMASGKLVCSGSSLFLKKRYGVGYHMNMVKTASCHVQPIETLIKNFVPNAKMESDAGAELSFILPSESSARFEELFTALDAQKETLGISSWGASVTTMEEVFLKVGEDHNKSTDDESNSQLSDEEQDTSLLGKKKVAKNTGPTLWLQQLWAVLLKRMLCSWRSPLLNLVQLSLPIVFALLGCLMKYNYNQTLDDQSPLTFAFSNYDSPISPYKGFPHDDVSEPSRVEHSFTSYMHDQNVHSTPFIPGYNDSAVIDYLALTGEQELESYRNHHIVAAYFHNFTDPQPMLMARGYFNNEAIHSPAMALTSITNTILRYLSNNDDLSIVTTNHPLPLPLTYRADNSQKVGGMFAVAIIMVMAFGMAFLVATFVIFPIDERHVKAKQCQYMSGLPPPIYWFGTYFWDLIKFLIPCIAIVIMFVAFDIQEFISTNNAGTCVLLFVGYGVASLPFVYLISFLFNGATAGYVVIFVVNIVTGTVAMVTVLILGGSSDSRGKIVEWVFYILLPNFCFNQGMMQLSSIQLKNQVLTMQGKEQVSPLDWEDGAGRAVVFMFVQAIVYFSLIFVLESGFAKKVFQKIVTKTMLRQQRHVEPVPVTSTSNSTGHDNPLLANKNPEDSDVAMERARIENAFQDELVQTESIVLHGLTKHYGRLLAVDNLSLGIKQGECFGLLGVNGAGKTTTFKMLTGEELITAGNAYVNGFSVASQIKEVQKCIGYCPQYDALLSKLTVRETLTMYARIRGVLESKIKRDVDILIKKLLLTEYADKRAGNLSGGNKRKLSTAVALIGEPPILFLDEPTTGVDPAAKRQLWNTLIEARKAGRTIVLTSHSMEECEALCTRLVVMVNGQFKCVGASQHLKDKFGEGYSLMAKVTPAATPEETHKRAVNLIGFIEHTFPSSIRKDYQPGLVLYQILGPDITLAQVFGQIEKNKSDLLIEDYSASQTTLEQVFINFARNQKSPEMTPLSCGNVIVSAFSSTCCT